MNRQEVKTGQSIDVLKHGLVNPVLVDNILQIPGLPTDLSLVDIGSGDATSSRDLLIALISNGKRINNLALVDADTGIFPDLIGTVTSEPIASFDTQVVQAHSRSVTTEFLRHYEEKYDLALSQLVLHQISNDYEASYLVYLAYQALKPTGDLFVVNLHPKYLQYLAENEPDKFVVTKNTNGSITGTYKFDSSGTASVHSRSTENQLAMFLSLGFDFVKVVPISTTGIADQKPRYRALAEEDIPMFYLMQLRKNPANFISSSEGMVDNMEPYNDQWITIRFLDGDEIKIPGFRNWQQVVKGDRLVLQEIHRNEIDATMINYWVIGSNEEIMGGPISLSKTGFVKKLRCSFCLYGFAQKLP